MCGGVGRGSVGKSSDLLTLRVYTALHNRQARFKVTVLPNLITAHGRQVFDVGMRNLQLREIKGLTQTALNREALCRVPSPCGAFRLGKVEVRGCPDRCTLSPSLDPGTEKQGESEGSSSGGFLAEGAIGFGWDSKEGEAGVNFGEGRGWESGRAHRAKGGGRTGSWPELQQSGMSWNDSERRSEGSPEGPGHSGSWWLYMGHSVGTWGRTGFKVGFGGGRSWVRIPPSQLPPQRSENQIG